jgi:hypothetical protein
MTTSTQNRPSDTAQKGQRSSRTYQAGNLDIALVSPSDISAVKQTDGWHQVKGARFTMFGVGPEGSEPRPNKLFSAIQYQDAQTRQPVVTPLSQVLSFQIEGLEQNS